MSNPSVLVESFSGSLGTFIGADPIRYDEGLWLERSGANLVTNPSAEVSSTGHTGWSTGVVTTITGDPLSTGANCIQYTAAGGVEGGRYTLPHSATGDFVFSCDVWLASGPSDWILLAIDNTFATLASLTFSAIAGRQRLALPLPSLGAHTSLAFVIRRATPSAGAVRVDALDLESGLIASSHIDGTLGTGYAWGGTAHASTSTRAASSASVTIAEPAAVACWYREGYSGPKTFAYLEPYGTLGTYGSIAYAAGDLTISTSRNLVIGPFAAFDRALTAGEQANLRSTQNWTMNSVNGSNIILPLSGARRRRR